MLKVPRIFPSAAPTVATAMNMPLNRTPLATLSWTARIRLVGAARRRKRIWPEWIRSAGVRLMSFWCYVYYSLVAFFCALRKNRTWPVNKWLQIFVNFLFTIPFLYPFVSCTILSQAPKDLATTIIVTFRTMTIIGKVASMVGLRNITQVPNECVIWCLALQYTLLWSYFRWYFVFNLHCWSFNVPVLHNSIGSYNSSYGAHSSGTSYERRNESRTWAEWLGLSPSK